MLQNRYVAFFWFLNQLLVLFEFTNWVNGIFNFLMQQNSSLLHKFIILKLFILAVEVLCVEISSKVDSLGCITLCLLDIFAHLHFSRYFVENFPKMLNKWINVLSNLEHHIFSISRTLSNVFVCDLLILNTVFHVSTKYFSLINQVMLFHQFLYL